MKTKNPFGKKNRMAATPPEPEKNTPEKDDDDNDCTRPRPGVTDPQKNDPTRIEEPGKNDPTRIPDPDKSKS